ncbi:hypothetical protein UAJ10_05950 [Nitrospirillum sp. BR 11164]|uniref:hypothetical protein n=1 Tax=Nitrospirillum sp. BR 11164 TaxID=3104324 RepID=UPI002AFF238E|nr:hypothetical protein [Nitrospirillum sp. BR 11164]MEA1648555.1 hypothetical protein [Nitrospirillum sp. BR 11164]
MLSERHLQLLRLSIPSVWALETLLFLYRGRDRAWTVPELVLHLRSSAAAIEGALAPLAQAGLVVAEDDAHRFQPAGPLLEAFVRDLETAYAEQPLSIIKAILSTPNSRIKSFADAFKLSKD